MLKSLIGMVAVSLASMVLLCSDVQAITYVFSGSSCQPDNDTTAHSQTTTGIRNGSAQATYWCPIVGNEDDDNDIASARINITDGNNNASGGSFSCYFFTNTLTGSYTASGTKYSCDTTPAGGCDTDDSDHTTSAGTDDYLNWTDPVGASTIYNIGTYGFSCSVPPVDGGVYSYIRRSTVVQTPE